MSISHYVYSIVYEATNYSLAGEYSSQKIATLPVYFSVDLTVKGASISNHMLTLVVNTVT